MPGPCWRQEFPASGAASSRVGCVSRLVYCVPVAALPVRQRPWAEQVLGVALSHVVIAVMFRLLVQSTVMLC
eukprot:10289407-Alexandrium_andersonii.AAC.1